MPPSKDYCINCFHHVSEHKIRHVAVFDRFPANNASRMGNSVPCVVTGCNHPSCCCNSYATETNEEPKAEPVDLSACYFCQETNVSHFIFSASSSRECKGLYVCRLCYSKEVKFDKDTFEDNLSCCCYCSSAIVTGQIIFRYYFNKHGINMATNYVCAKCYSQIGISI